MSQNLQPIIISSIENPLSFNDSSISYSIFAIVYIIGLLAVSIRSITGVATLVYLYWRFPKQNYQGFRTVIIQGSQSPFTFFNFLFINAKDFKKDKADELIVHEQVHRDQFHTIDLILMEFFTAIHWFNPFIWLFKYDLKSEHEFKADEQVMNKGYNTTRYQNLLLQSNEGIALYLANNFNYSILKKRLKMMNNKKSNRVAKFKYVLAMPVLLMSAAFLFLNFQLNEQVSSSPDEMPKYKSGEKAFYRTIQNTIKYPSEARKSNAQGKVFVSFTVTKNGVVKEIKADQNKFSLLEEMVVVGYANDVSNKKINDDLSVLQKESERVVALLGEFSPGLKNGKAIDTRLTLPITFKIQ